MSILLGVRSQRNSYARHVVGLYLYASGAQRQVFSVLSHLGLSCSYPSLVGSGTQSANNVDAVSEQGQPVSIQTMDAPDGVQSILPNHVHGRHTIEDVELESGSDSSSDDEDETDLKADNMEESNSTVPKVSSTRSKTTGVGLIKRLSDACRTITREKARTTCLSYVYDNVNISFRVAEQVLGRKSALENGTCATAFSLFEATPEDLRTADLVDAFASALPLSTDDILLTTGKNLSLQG